MPDLPDYYTQIIALEAEAFKFRGGADASKSADPTSRDVYFATDTQILYVCVVDGAWVGLDAATLTEGILTLYANLAGGGFRITNIADPVAAQDAATRAYVLARVGLYLPLAGGTMAGNIIMGGNRVTGLGAPAAQDDALRYNRTEIRNAEIAAAAAIAYSKLNLTGSILTADIAAAEFNVASKLVKLDAAADVPDAQIPNLDAAKITSGRFSKSRLEWTGDRLLVGAGVGANPTEIVVPATATKEFFVPATGTSGGVAADFYATYAVIGLSAGDYAKMAFHIPHDFNSITEAVIVVILRGSDATADWDINSAYGASGEAYNTHTEGDNASVYNVTNNQLFEVDISGILTALAADDYVGVELFIGAGEPDVDVLGVRFRYS